MLGSTDIKHMKLSYLAMQRLVNKYEFILHFFHTSQFDENSVILAFISVTNILQLALARLRTKIYLNFAASLAAECAMYT